MSLIEFFRADSGVYASLEDCREWREDPAGEDEPTRAEAGSGKSCLGALTLTGLEGASAMRIVGRPDSRLESLGANLGGGIGRLSFSFDEPPLVGVRGVVAAAVGSIGLCTSAMVG